MHDTITAVILAGGLGTRLRSEVADRPKVLAPVAGHPFLEHIFEQLRRFQIRKVVLCTGYMAEQIEALYGSEFGGLSLTYSREHSLLGTAGAIRFALPLVSTERVLVLNGDSFCEFNLRDLVHFHRDHAARASLVLTHVEDCARYGSVILDSNQNILSFIEKSAAGGPGYINAGAYLMERERIAYIPPGRILSLEKDIFPTWVGDGFCGFASKSPMFIDIGTPQSFHCAQTVFSERMTNG